MLHYRIITETGSIDCDMNLAGVRFQEAKGRTVELLGNALTPEGERPAGVDVIVHSMAGSS